MKIEQKQHNGKGMFYTEENGEQLAEMTYAMANGKMVIDHTGVDDRLQGRGIGKQLVTAAVEYAREHKIKILPLCPFAKAIFDKTPDFNDVLSD